MAQNVCDLVYMVGRGYGLLPTPSTLPKLLQPFSFSPRDYTTAETLSSFFKSFSAYTIAETLSSPSPFETFRKVRHFQTVLKASENYCFFFRKPLQFQTLIPF